MECREVHAALRQGQFEGQDSGLNEQLDEHLGQCAACAELAADAMLASALAATEDDELGETGLDALWAGTQEELGREQRWTRSLRNTSTPVRIALLLVFTTGLLGFMAARKLRPDWQSLSPALLAIVLGGLAVAVFGAVRAALAPAYRRQWSRSARWAMVGGVLLLTCLPLLLGLGHGDASGGGGGAGMAARCLMFGVGVAGVSTMALAVLSRGSRDVRQLPPAAWAYSAGMAVFALTLHCPDVSHVHVGLGHIGTGLLLVGFGAAASRLGAR